MLKKAIKPAGFDRDSSKRTVMKERLGNEET